MSLDIPINQLAGHRVHGHLAGAVDHAVGDNGLVVDAGERLGSFVGQDGGFGGHDGTLDLVAQVAKTVRGGH